MKTHQKKPPPKGRKRTPAEAARRKSEAHYRSLLNMLNGFAYCRMLYVAGRPHDFTYLEVNHAFETLTGLRNVVGKNVTALIPGFRETDPELLNIYGRVASTGVPERFETYVKALDKWFAIQVWSPRKGYFVAVFDVITARKQAEAALAESELRFRTLIEQAPMAISVSRDGVGIYANRKLAQLYGLPDAAAWAGRPILESFAPPSREKSTERTRRRNLGLPVPTEFESVGLRPDGSQFPIHVAVTQVQLADGMANIAFITDITERRRAEEKLAESETKLRALFEGSGYPMGLAKNGIHIMVNPAYAELFGYAEPSEVIGKPLLDDIAPEDRPRLREFARRRSRGESVPPVYETRGVRRDGTIFDMAVRVSTYELGGEVHSIGILRDITENKRAEAALRASQEQLRALAARIEHIREEERAGLARELHDELGQGLTALQIDLAWLDGRLRIAGPADLPGLRDKIAGMVPRAERLIETTQAISSSMRPGVLDDLGLVAAVEWLAADFAKRTGLACVAKLPPADLALDLALAVALFRIVQEALTNVIRHARASRAEVRLRRRGGDLVVEVEDNGRGITPQQVAAARSLGIFGMRERAGAFGGEVEFRSEAGRGTTVRVRVPFRPSAGKGGNP